MRKKLTALTIATLAEGNYHDSGSPGLQLRVGKTRSTWSAFHRLTGKLKQTTLGHYPQMSLGEARKAAAALSDAVEAGLPVEAPAPHPRDRVTTLADVIDRFEKYRRRRAGRGLKSLDKMLMTIRSGAGPYLDKPVTAFNGAALRECRDIIAARGAMIQSNRFLTCASTLLKWAASEEIVPALPVVLKIGAEQSRDRVLSRDELAAVWHACGAMDDYGRFIRMLMLTAMRRGECASMRFGDILDNTLRIDAKRTKSARPLVLPLPPLALGLIGEGPARQSVFGPLGRFETLKRRLDKASGVTGWRLHDLRRSAATHMQENGVSPDIIQSILNHAIAGVGSVYLRGQMEQAKREALQRWSNEVERIVAPRRRSI